MSKSNVPIVLGVAGLIAVIIAAAAKKSSASPGSGEPLSVRTIEVTGVVTYKVFKLGNGFFKIYAYRPGTENLGSDNEIAQFEFRIEGEKMIPLFMWGDGGVLDRLITRDIDRFPSDLFKTASTTLASTTGDDDRRTVLA